ncbi:alpha-1,3/1,6-mannosyltransferase ALG2-like [Onthophagus taurus]|uniref:alpha-1,3/1,6-mannosyltransferase ALG2-like n=1 Tax=Onthophagus taurus TaxID=166361 RepID=UPI0039BEC8BA
MVKVKSLKVAFFHPDLGIGGAERLVLDLAIALSDQGMEVSFITNHFNKNHAFEELKADKYPVTVIGDWIPRSIFGYFQALCAYIRMMYLALIYVIFFKYVDESDAFIVDQIPMAVPFLKKFTNKRVIYYCHHPDLLGSTPGGVLKRLYRKPIDFIERKGTEMSDVILVNSNYTSEVFHRTFSGVKKDLKIVYPTISNLFLNNLKKIKKKSIQELNDLLKTNMVDNSTLFLSINRFHPAKKLELSIEGLYNLKKNTQKPFHLIIAGGYDPNSTINKIYFNKLMELTQKLRLESNITFLKSPSDDLKSKLLVSCDCLLYTPINEHFGIVPLEAMAAGKVVIACNSGGPKETVENNVTGYLCEATDEGFSGAMLKVLGDDAKRTEMGREGLNRLQKKFGWEKFCSDVMGVVMDVVCGDNNKKNL